MASEFIDVVVLIPGITDSVLERDGREVWGTSMPTLLRGLLSGGRILQDLRLERDDPDADDPGDGVRATRLVDDVHLFPGLCAIDGYTKIAGQLRQRLGLSAGTDYFELPYDWRRDNRVAARALQRASRDWLSRRRQTHPEARLVLVAHSMGGLVARHFLEVLGGWVDTRALITFGTPYRGSVNALDALVNGVKKAGVLDLTELTRSFTSIYQLLPIYRCVDAGGPDLVHLLDAVDALPLSADQRARVGAAEAFHRRIEAAVTEQQATVPQGTVRYAIHPIVGIDQPTGQSVIVRPTGVDVLRSRNGKDEAGDGTVPRVAATPIEAGEGQATYTASRHGSLQNADTVFGQIYGLLTKPSDLDQLRAVTGPPITLSLDLDQVFARDEPVRFAVKPRSRGVALKAIIAATSGSAPEQTITLGPSDDDWLQCEVPPLPPDLYRLTVKGNPTKIQPVSEIFVVA